MTEVERCGFSQKVLNPDPIATGAALGSMPLARFTLVHLFWANNLDHLSFSHRLRDFPTLNSKLDHLPLAGRLEKTWLGGQGYCWGCYITRLAGGENGSDSNRESVDQVCER